MIQFWPTSFRSLKPVLLYPTMKTLVALFSSSLNSEFERLPSRVVGISSSSLLRCLISPKIKRELLALQPLIFTQTATLAKLQEDKFHDLRECPRNCFSFQPSPSPPSRHHLKGTLLPFCYSHLPRPTTRSSHMRKC